MNTCDDEYTNNLNKTSIYRNDLVMASTLFNETESFDPESLQDFDGIIGLFAGTGGGKSVLLKELIYKNKKKYPGGIYLMCKTASLQPGYSYIPEVNRMSSYSEEFLVNLWSKTTADFISQKDLKRILIIMDDFIGDPEYKKSKIIEDYAIGCRHLKISIIVLVQNFSSLRTSIRNNIRLAIAFITDCDRERKKFISDFLSAKNKRIGDVLFNHITKEKAYQCVVIEVYKYGKKEKEKIKKYLASTDLPKFVVKEYPASKYLEQMEYTEHTEHTSSSFPKRTPQYNLPSCEMYTDDYF